MFLVNGTYLACCTGSKIKLSISNKFHDHSYMAEISAVYSFTFLFYLYISPPDSQESNGGTNE